jgi:HD-like signal output (HDOD) protein
MAQETDAKNDGLDKTADASNEVKSGSPFAVLFPPDLLVWSEARRMIADKNVRVDDLAICASQDPSIVIELLKASNAMYFSAGRQPITSARTAIVRLGSDVALDLLDKMSERPQITDKEISHWLEIQRSRCKRTSLVAKIFAESVAKTLGDECQAVGLMMFVGEMLAVLHLGHEYIQLAKEMSRSALNYRLSHDFKFDVEKMGLNYLRRNGIPEALLFALDREGRSKSAEKAIMKPICLAAGELIEAFDSNRWDKFAPGKTIPPKSAIRTLPITETQYVKLYERVSEYLFAIRVTDEKRRFEALHGKPQEEPSPAQTQQEILQSEIQNILSTSAPDETTVDKDLVTEKKSENKQQNVPTPQASTESTSDPSLEFSLKKDTASKPARKESRKTPIAPPTLVNKRASTVIASMTDVLNAANNSEELLSKIMSMLVDNGPFSKSALIVVSKDKTKALVVAARGPNIGNGQRLDITDPLNPLAQCFSKVQSFGNKESKLSPFGSRTFALSPIDAAHETPVALYADCGNEGSISFEARRVFRTVIEILNEKLPTIPGGIPVEI